MLISASIFESLIESGNLFLLMTAKMQWRGGRGMVPQGISFPVPPVWILHLMSLVWS